MSTRDDASEADWVADVIERFLDGSAEPWEWDDFLHSFLSSRRLRVIQARCARLPGTHPPERAGDYCSEEGARILHELVAELRRGD